MRTMGDSPTELVMAEPTHGCSLIASNRPSATARIVSFGVVTTVFVHRTGDHSVAGGGKQVALVGDVPVNSTGAGGEPFRQRAEGQTHLSARVQQFDRRFDDAFPGERFSLSRPAKRLLDHVLS